MATAGNCGDGFQCNPTADGTKGAMYAFPSPTQKGDFCTAGNYCSFVSALGPQPCPIGTYNPDTGRGTCINCLQSLYCDTTGMTDPINCPPGNYCPAFSALISVYAPVPCAVGSYSIADNIGTQDDCIPC